MTKRRVPRPAVETELSHLAFLAEQLEAVIFALDSAHGDPNGWAPFAFLPGDLSQDQLAEGLKHALFDQAGQLAQGLRAGLTALAAGDRKAA